MKFAHSTRSPFAPRNLGMAAVFALVAASTASAQDPAYGDWFAAGNELYVSPTGTPAGPGTLAQPFSSIGDITSLINLDLLANPLTINVLSGTYNAASGETFPIVLPAHGVSVEAFDLRAGGRPVFDAAGTLALETIIFSSVGNTELPDSVIRGLDIRHDTFMNNSAELRIDVPTPLEGVERIAVEVRDCEISGSATVGVDMVGREGIEFECVLERSLIFPVNGKEQNASVGVRVLGESGPTSPVIRSNQIQSFPTNVQFQGGDLANQPRLWSNFIQVGGTNLDVNDSSPYVVGNTIAFAFAPSNAVGIRLTGVTEMTLANNLIWNPQHGGMGYNPLDVTGDFSSFDWDPIRGAWFNLDEDDALYNYVTLGFGLPNFGPVSTGDVPGFVGGDLGAGPLVTDLHLTAGSLMRERGVDLETTTGDPFFSVGEVPGLPASIFVRRDHSHDGDFDARITGQYIDIGADECIEPLPAVAPLVSLTRTSMLMPTIGTGNDLDELGNLHPDGAGNWATQVSVTGTSGDLIMLISGVGFADTIPNPGAGPATLGNKALYENLLLSGLIYPGMLGGSSLSTGISPLNTVLITGGISTGVPLSIPVGFGAFNPAFVEAEAHLQAFALTVDGNGATVIQTTNRLSLDLNE